MDITNKIVQMNKRFIIGLIGLAVSAGLIVGSLDVSATNTDDVVVEDSDVTMQIGSSKSSDKANSISKVKVIGNYRTVSKAKIKAAQKKNRCKKISGQKAIDMGVMTQGYNGSGVSYAPENRTTTLCDTNNDGKYDVRAECGNKVKVTRKPRPQAAKATVWVNDFSKVKANITAKVSVMATAKCQTDYASATAAARATATAKAAVKVKTLTGANGKVKTSELAKITTKAKSSASAQAKASATAKVNAKADCKSVVVPASQPVTPETPKTPEQPAPEKVVKTKVVKNEVISGKGAPERLPETGPGAVIGAFIGVSSLGSLLHAAITRRFGL